MKLREENQKLKDLLRELIDSAHRDDAVQHLNIVSQVEKQLQEIPESTDYEDALKRAQSLYTLTGDDWIVETHSIVTEPVCPSIDLYPEQHETSPLAVRGYLCNNIFDGITEAIEIALKRARKG